jgi:hypothetical protein
MAADDFRCCRAPSQIAAYLPQLWESAYPNLVTTVAVGRAHPDSRHSSWVRFRPRWPFVKYVSGQSL